LKVSVKDTASSTTQVVYSQVDNIVGIKTTSEIYLLQEVQDEKYEILFGDGVIGKRLSSGNVVTASYVVSDGENGNGVANFSFVGKLVDNNGALVVTGVSDINTNQPSRNGSEIENISTIKNLAPRVYASQYRAVTANDYQSIIATIYSNAEGVIAYGGEDATPPQFGRVFISIKPKNGQYISDFDKKQILQDLKSYSVAGIQPQIVDLKYLYVELESSVYYNSNTLLSPSDLKTQVTNSLTTYSKSADLNKFGGRFKYSKVQKIIDDTNTSITSNITKVTIRRNLEANTANFAQYELCYGNAFHAGRKGYNIKSTGFVVDGIDGTLYFGDVWENETTGRLFAFRLLSDGTPEVVISNAGTVKYDVGEILIDTIRILSTVKSDNIIEIQAVPESNDIIGLKDLFLQLSVDNSNISTLEDLISTGADNSGTRFISTSSFSNGKYIRQ